MITTLLRTTHWVQAWVQGRVPPRPQPADAARRNRLFGTWLGGLALMVAALPAVQAQSRVDVDQARQALARGAVAWDLRPSGAVLPGAVRVQTQALEAWLQGQDSGPLSLAVSGAGLNLSAEVILVAADDAQAQAVAEQLRPLVRGRLAWLAGGVAAWQAAGLPLQALPSQRLPVPQHLVPAAPAEVRQLADAKPADAARRATHTWRSGSGEIATAAAAATAAATATPTPLPVSN